MSETKVLSVIAGTVWKITSKTGDAVAEDDPVMILESMKMEIPVLAPAAGILKSIAVSEGDSVSEGDVLAVIGKLP